MRKLFIFILLSLNSYAFEFKKINYELLSGDEKICEDGTLKVYKNDLILGTRYIFPNFKDAKYQYSSDDKSCEYLISNKETSDTYTQELKQICKKKIENLNRKIVLKYNSHNNLVVEMTINEKLNTCLLKEIK